MTAIKADAALNLRRRILILARQASMAADGRAWLTATALARNGCIVSVICPERADVEAPDAMKEMLRVYRYPLKANPQTVPGRIVAFCSALTWQFMLANQIFLSRGIDAVHVCNPPDGAFLIGGFFKIFFTRKYVFDFCGSEPDRYEARFSKKGFTHGLLRKIERGALSLADEVIAVNESCRAMALERGKAKKVTVVRAAADMALRAFTPSKGHERTCRIICMSDLDEISGVPYLIEAARILTQERKRRDIAFTVMGDGPALEAMKKLAALESVNIVFAGALSGDTLREMLAASDICVHCAKVNAFSKKISAPQILSYMAAGKPFIQFDTKEGRNLAGEASLYAESNNAEDLADRIAELLDDPAKREAMGLAGYKRVKEEFAWANEAPKLLAVYDALFDVKKKME